MEDVLRQLGYPNEIYHLLKEPSRVLKVRIPVRMDDDKIRIFTGYRIQHHDLFGVTQGNVHFRPTLTEKEVSALAILRSVKASNLQLPLGGSCGGVVCDPRELSYRELERLCRGYVRVIQHVIGPQLDIPSSDASLDPQIMAWMMDEYSRLNANEDPNFITGKPFVLGGLKKKEEAIKQGILQTILSLTEQHQLDLHNTRILIHGTGQIGSYLADALYEKGAKIVGISDPQAAIFEEDGIDIPELWKSKDRFGIITRNKNSITIEELMRQQADVLILTTKNEQITKELAEQLHSTFIVETVSHTLEREAIHFLHQQQVQIIPEVLSTTGGIIYAYIEWMEHKQGKKFTDDEITELFGTINKQAIQAVSDIAEQKDVNLYTASYMIGLRNQAEALRFRGWL